jgi:hypothetical protein
MILSELSLPDLIGMFVSFLLTLMVFSYVIGDNALFRIAISIFVGVASGYAAVVIWYNVLWPQLIYPVIYGGQNDRMFAIIPLALGVLLLFKAVPRFSMLGNPAVAYLLGVGMAAAIGGAILGTVVPQSVASMNLLDLRLTPPEEDAVSQLVKGGAILLGTLTTLLYFHFRVRQVPNQSPARPRWMEPIAWVGQAFIAVTFGALFAGIYSAALTALIERVQFLKDFLFALVAS